MAVTKRTRFEVLKRDNYTCRYCRSAEESLTIDHVTPVALGGSDAPENLVACCKDCNAGKSSTSPGAPLVADVADDAVRWSAAIATYNATQMIDRKKRDAYVRRFSKEWNQWRWGTDQGKSLPRPADWKPTIWQWYASGLPIAELEDAVTIAASNGMVQPDAVFRYVCGVVRNKIERMHDGAIAHLHSVKEEVA